MKNNIIEIEEGLECYVLDEIEEENNHYIFCIQTDEENEKILENYLICKVTFDLDGNHYIEKIDDKKTFERISNIFLERLKENE